MAEQMQSICDVCHSVTLWKQGGNQTSQLFAVCSLFVEGQARQVKNIGRLY